MGRKLPWKTKAASPAVKRIKAETPASNKRGGVASPRLARSSPSAGAQRRQAAAPRGSNPDDDNVPRSPSTSPPPEPPNEECMRPGDEEWRMVEDELLAVAQRFTAHLHRAEYNRLRQQAASRNAATIRSIERPVVGAPTEEIKRRQDALGRKARQSTLTDQTDRGEGSTQNAEPTGLRGLLDSPKKDGRMIKMGRGDASQTKVAAGLGDAAMRSSPTPARRAPRTTSSDPISGRTPTVEPHTAILSGALIDDTASDASPNGLSSDEYEGLDLLRVKRGSHRMEKQPQHTPRVASSTKSTPRQTPVNREFTTPSRPKMVINTGKDSGTAINVESDDEEDDDDPFGIRQKRARREKSREQLRRDGGKREASTIPSFI